MELLFLFVPIIYVLFFILSCKENKYLKKHEEDEDNFCAPTDFNPANGAPMIGCLDIYGNPYGVSGAEDNHNDYHIIILVLIIVTIVHTIMTLVIIVFMMMIIIKLLMIMIIIHTN